MHNHISAIIVHRTLDFGAYNKRLYKYRNNQLLEYISKKRKFASKKKAKDTEK